jgi:hypothetical protein
VVVKPGASAVQSVEEMLPERTAPRAAAAAGGPAVCQQVSVNSRRKGILAVLRAMLGRFHRHPRLQPVRDLCEWGRKNQADRLLSARATQKVGTSFTSDYSSTLFSAEGQAGPLLLDLKFLVVSGMTVGGRRLKVLH